MKEKTVKFILMLSYFIHSQIFIPFLLFFSIFLSKDNKYKLWLYFSRIIYRNSFFLSNIKIKVYGLEKVSDKPFIFAADHRSITDSWAFLIVMKRYFFTLTAPLESFPWYLRPWIQNVGLISIFRDDKDKKKFERAVLKEEAIFEVNKRLQKGQSMLIYPEGHHERHNHMLRFKTGAVRFAIESKVPIIPVAIVGTDHIITPTKNKIHSGEVHIKFGDPIYYDKYYGKVNNHKLVKKLTLDLRKEVDKLIRSHKV